MVREAVRSLRQDVRFTVVAAALLAVTIGALSAIYAVVDAVLVRPLPFADQERVVVIWQRDDRRALPVIEVAYAEMTDWRSRSRSFTDMAVVGSVNWNATVVWEAETERLPIAAVSASFFSVVGAPPLHGRPLQAADEHGSMPRAAVIGHGYWLRRFGGNPAAVGRTLRARLQTDGPEVPIEVVGVLPREFDYPRGVELWLPAAPLVRTYGESWGGADVAMRRLRVFYALGRLRDGVSLTDATREATDVMRTAETTGIEPSAQVELTPILRYLLGPAQPVLWTMLAGALLMLVIACANVAGLQVARAARAQRALAIRSALGASDGRLLLERVGESVLLTLAALMGSLLIAHAVSRALVSIAPADVPRLDETALWRWPVIGVAGVAACVTLLISGLWPAVAARRVDVARLLAGTGTGVGAGSRRVQRFVVVTQMAVALTLLAGTALFLRTVAGLDRTVLGFEPDRLLAVTVTPATRDAERRAAIYETLIDRVEALPDVVTAAAVSRRPLAGPIGWDGQPVLHGQVPEDPATWTLNPYTNVMVVTPGYFETMGIRLVAGRVFTPGDSSSSPGVLVVSERAARRLWPGLDPIGQRLRAPGHTRGAHEWQTVVGVVDDVRYRGLTDPRLDLYLPAPQSSIRVQALMVRTRANPAAAVAAIHGVVGEVDPTATVGEATIMGDAVAAESAPWRFLVRVFVSFAALAATLAAVGLAAVIALAVSLRRRELAIRAALGADRARLRAAVLRESLPLLALGVGLGLLGALALGRAVSHVLVGVGPHDPIALTAAAAIGLCAGLSASWLPARAAADADPLEVLRAE